MTDYRLAAAPKTTHWGYFDAALAPVLEIDDGNSITIDTINGRAEHLPPTGFKLLPDYGEIHGHVAQWMPGHILTGPVAVRGAEPGDVLEVSIESVELRQDWGYAVVRPLEGALPDEFAAERLIHIPLDRQCGTGRLPWGMSVPLRPFFGVMAVAPPPAWGVIGTIEPRRHGGNIDNKELVAGTSLFLPIHVRGANFSCGDGHAVQGDGEVCVSAIETSMTGRFRLKIRRDMALEWPMAETPTHMIAMGFDPDLGRAARHALRSLIDLIVTRKGLSRTEAYMLCSFVADVRVTQMVNNHNGIHIMFDKRYLA